MPSTFYRKWTLPTACYMQTAAKVFVHYLKMENFFKIQPSDLNDWFTE